MAYLIKLIISNYVFLDVWMESQVTPLPKVRTPNDYEDLKPISIPPVSLKSFDNILTRQIESHLEVFNPLPTQ